MADIVLRNLDDQLKQRLRERAALHGQSMAAELRAIVADALNRSETVDATAEFKRLSAQVRALSAGRTQTPSEDLLRQGRDER